ncbi:MAG: leucine-rich repeat domain-containing protein [Clostridiales bacterium]|nr:leucine-rich repeat domain-containing protein [Clostridiales bacterium]
MSRKSTRLLLAFILPVLMIAVSVSAVVGLSGLFSDKEVLADEEVYTLAEGECSVPFRKTYTKCTFTPDTTGYYDIQSIGNTITAGLIGNSEFDPDTNWSAIIDASWGYESDRNFHLLIKLEEGTLYNLFVVLNAELPDGSEEIVLPIRISMIGTSGSCGDNATWSYDETTKTLTFSGNGPMAEQSSEYYVPWSIYKDQVESVVVEDGITTITSYAFYRFPYLTSVTIPDSVKSIGRYAFYYCTALADLPVMNGVETLGDTAFYGCSELTSIVIPDNITKMGSSVFAWCDHLENVTLGSGLTEISCGAFGYCTALSSVSVPDGITIFDDRAFSGCTSLTSITIPEGVTYLGDGVFDYCTMLSEVEIPDSVTYIGTYAFKSCYELTSIKIPDGVTSILSETFQYCSNLTSVEIPSSVTKIGYSAFFCCQKLTDIVIPYGVESIDSSAFYYCKNLKNVSIPNTVESIGNEAFRDCDALESISIPDSVEYIYLYAFADCDILEEVIFGSGLKYIGSEAFRQCPNLKEMNLPESLEEIGNQAFMSDSKLESVSIPSGSIGAAAFKYCYALSDVTLGEGVTYIGDSAFLDLDAITQITIPKSISSIGPYAFYDCDGITSIYIPENITRIERYSFYDCGKLGSVTIEGSTTVIEKYAFFNCRNLSELILGEGVTEIGSCAFESCVSLTTLTIPASMKTIYDAFEYCDAITDIYCYANPDHFSWSGNGSYEFLSNRATKCHVLSSLLQKYINNFENYVNVTFVGDLDQAVNMNLGAVLYGYTLSLEGDIGVNFYMDLSGTDLSDDAYVKFTVPNGNSTREQIVYVKDAGKDMVGEKTCHVFKCKVSPKDASSLIKAQIIDGENGSKVFAYSVRQYAEFLYSHRFENAEYARAANLVDALMCYCTCAQDYFNVARERFDYEWKNFFQIGNVVINAPEKIVALDNVPGVTFVGAKLSLRSETELKLYFLCEDDTTFSCANGDIETITDGEYKVVVVRNINARDIGESFQIKAIRGTNTGLVKYSILNYCDSVVNSSEYSDLLKDTVRSLVYYYHETVKYGANGGSNNA